MIRSPCVSDVARGGTWNEDGVIVFGDQTPGLQRIPASGGEPLPVTRVNKEAGETYHYFPQFLPGGKGFLYLVRHHEVEKMGIYIGSLDYKSSPRLVQTERQAAYDGASSDCYTYGGRARWLAAGIGSSKTDRGSFDGGRRGSHLLQRLRGVFGFR